MKYWISLSLTFIVAITVIGLLVLRLPPLLSINEIQLKGQEENLQSTLLPVAKIALQAPQIVQKATKRNESDKIIQDNRLLLQEVVAKATASPTVTMLAVVDDSQHIVAASDLTWKGEFMLRVCSFPGQENMSEKILRKWPVIGDGGVAIGNICVGVNPLLATNSIQRLQEILIVVGLGLLLIVFPIFILGKEIVSRKLLVLKDNIEKIGKGDWTIRINASGQDVVAQFSRTLDTMTQELNFGTADLRASEERFQLAIKGSNDVIWDWNIQTDRLYLSPRYASLLAYSEREIPGLFNAWVKFIYPDDVEIFKEALDEHLQRNTTFNIEFRIRARDGNWRWFLARGQAVRDDQNHPKRMVGSLSDISTRKEAEAAFSQQKERLETILRSIVDGVITTDKNAVVDYLNVKAEKLVGWDLERASGMLISDIIFLEDQEASKNAPEPVALDAQTVANDVLNAQEVMISEQPYTLHHQEGKKFIVDYQVSPLRDHSGMMIGTIFVLHDITERLELSRNLDREKERAQVTLHSIADGVITTDTEGRVDNMNPSAEAMTGWPQAEAKGVPLPDVFKAFEESNKKPVANNATMKQVLIDGKTFQVNESILVNKSDTEKRYHISHSIAPILDYEGDILGSVLIIQNNTQQRKLHLRLQYEATHDMLTGLYNRYEFEKRLTHLIKKAMSGERHVMCYLDLDQFKLVNDTSGHEAGDELLRQLAKLLEANLPTDVLLARLGGDEFGLLLENYSYDAATSLAKGLREEINQFHFVWKENTFTVGVSTAVVPLSKHIETAQDALRAADQACYMAKSKGRNYIQLYEQNEESNAWQGQMQWVHRLTHAIRENKNLILFAQPIVPLKPEDTGYKHFELLIRMTDEEGKFVSPGLFLPGAERYGLISDLDRWVVDNAIKQMVTALKRNPDMANTVFSINLSGASLTSEEFLTFVKQVIKRYQVPTQMVCFEITESVAVANLDQARHFVHELQKIGCRFSLDDFGSGYASFSYLKNLPVNYLKIDGSFVKNILTDPYDGAMVNAINYVGHTIGLKTIAEFVENEQIVQKLRKIGINYGQGYYFGKPQSMIEVCSRRG